MRPKHHGLQPKVLTVSAIEGTGIDIAWNEIASIHSALAADDRLSGLRADQTRRWFWSEVQAAVSDAILLNASLAAQAAAWELAVSAGKATPYGAARALMTTILPA